MAGFRNSILGGINLIRAAIQSPNFVSGTSGWTVRQDGSAEFNNVVIRGGTVIGGTALYYNGTPAAGNLIMSISATAGTDSFGNAYVAGVGVYGTSDKVTVRNTGGDTAVLRADAPSGIADTPAPGLALALASGDVAPGSLTEFDDTFTRGLYLRTSSPVADPGASEGQDYAAIRMTGRFHGNNPTMQLRADGTGSTISINDTTFDASGQITSYAAQLWTPYTPVMGGSGGATFSTRAGVWRRYGDDIRFMAYFVCNGAGSGASNITVTAPTGIDRTLRQFVPAHTESFSAGNNGSSTALAFTSGSGSTFDRIRNSTNGTITGADVLNGALLTICGSYREGL